MNKRRFWRLIKAGRDQLPVSRPVEGTVAAEQALWDLMADSSHRSRRWHCSRCQRRVL
ncbi:hypothetical protein GCM10010302_41750 [Streptomyces polychromogenes]|uniref:Uncharacterized protein n=1 Tax=Streptomyces polychromogenes TaxID=67342 RepID=A0ABP3F6D8_9ACTN